MQTHHRDLEGPLTAYVAWPDDAPDAPGVVVIHEVWGVDAHIRSVVDRLAAAGYRAIAPDLFGFEVKIPPEALFAGFRAIQTIPPEERAVPARIQEAMQAVPEQHRDAVSRLMAAASKGTKPEGFAIVKQAVDHLKDHGAKKVAVMGFCFGGRVTWAYAYAGGEADAFVPFYGPAPDDKDPAKVQGPVEGHFGSEDHGIPIPPLEQAAADLRAQGKHAVIHVYEAPHAFFNDTKDAYRPEAAKLAWERTLSFLADALKTPPAR
jgi:carboxymethylenebutenolidase